MMSFDSPRAGLRRFALLALALCAAIGLSSCSSQERVLARVGARTITADEFLAVARTSQGQYPWLPDSAKRVLLDDMIRRELMLNEAEQQGLTRDSLTRAIRRGAEEDLILGSLTEEIAERNVPVTDAELATFYAWRKTEHHVEAIHAADPSIAAHAAVLLAAGEPFSSVAARFNVSGVVPPSGDLGFIQGGALPEPFDTKVREAPIGQWFGPLKVGSDAWFIARVMERREADLPPADLLRDQMVPQLRQRKYRAQIQRSIESLRAAYEVRLEPGAAQEMFARGGGLSDSTEAAPRSDDAIVLARYRDPHGEKVYTMADAMLELESTPQGPDFSSVPALQHWIDAHVMRRVVLAEARRRHLHEEPDVVGRIEDRVEGAALQALYDREVSMRVRIDDNELRDDYNRRTVGQAAPPFEQTPTNLREQLRSVIMEERRDQLLQQFTDALRRKYPVHVDQALLKRLPWPSPALQVPTQG